MLLTDEQAAKLKEIMKKHDEIFRKNAVNRRRRAEDAQDKQALKGE